MSGPYEVVTIQICNFTDEQAVMRDGHLVPISEIVEMLNKLYAIENAL